MTEAWAIYRELAHSPGRETDDAMILRMTAEKLEPLGFEVAMKTPDEAIDEPSAPPLVLAMCERVPIIETLNRWAARGSVIINHPSAIFDTYRHRMIEAFARGGVPFPKSELVATAAGAHALDFPLWVKRADVHATQASDVAMASDESGLRALLESFASRGIDRAVLQEHVAGDLIKFYGIGTGDDAWFVWFYHKHQTLNGYAFDPARLRGAARRAADAIDVDVFGGDAIVTRNGDLSIIDLNAWPSFALYRDEAAMEIATYVAARFAAVITR